MRTNVMNHMMINLRADARRAYWDALDGAAPYPLEGDPSPEQIDARQAAITSFSRSLRPAGRAQLLSISRLGDYELARPINVQLSYAKKFNISHARIPAFEHAAGKTRYHRFSCYAEGTPQCALDLLADQLATVWTDLAQRRKNTDFGRMNQKRLTAPSMARMYEFLAGYVRPAS